MLDGIIFKTDGNKSRHFPLKKKSHLATAHKVVGHHHIVRGAYISIFPFSEFAHSQVVPVAG